MSNVVTRGTAIVQQLKRKLGVATDRQLADKLGISLASVTGWKAREEITPLQVAGLLATAVNTAEVRAAMDVENSAIRPIVEYFPLNKCKSRGGARYELFDSGNGHKYLNGLRAELAGSHGIYVFYDSRGHAIYVGKAREQKLWQEMNSAYNRNRDVQTIMKVNHPERNQSFKTSDEKKRQIREFTVQLHQIAAYVSAYKVIDGMVNSVEAMLVRSFANDLLNVKMESIA